MTAHPVMHAAELPRWRTMLVFLGVLIALSVYYVNYGADVEEGVVEGRGPLGLPLRILAVILVLGALLPLRRPPTSVLLCITLYILCAATMVMAAGRAGGFNDILFFNTVLQLPLLLAFSSTKWELDQRAIWRFICVVLAFQALGDAAVSYGGASLWLSAAFVGGTGNPSSYGFLCVLGLTFCLFHRQAGRGAAGLALVLGGAAVMSLSLFSIMAVSLASLYWLMRRPQRVLIATVVVIAIVALFGVVGEETELGKEARFIEHKLSALGALLGLMEYDVQSSGSVAVRIDMYTTTTEMLNESPVALLFGGLGSQGYWVVDSQIFTYLGSFGVIILAVFLGLHCYWIWQAWSRRRDDGLFCTVALVLFAGIFVTNRILDYFPVAAAYFLLIAEVSRRASRPTASSATSRSERGSSGRTSMPLKEAQER